MSGTSNSPRDGVYAAGHHLFTDRDGRVVAKYRGNWPAVHASWSSVPGYKPGQTGRSVGELHYAGVVETKGDLGPVVAMQGNYGQAFVWSGDGLFVTPLFKDSRLNPKGWGATEEFGADWTDVSLYGEPFGGMRPRRRSRIGSAEVTVATEKRPIIARFFPNAREVGLTIATPMIAASTAASAR